MKLFSQILINHCLGINVEAHFYERVHQLEVEFAPMFNALHDKVNCLFFASHFPLYLLFLKEINTRSYEAVSNMRKTDNSIRYNPLYGAQ